MEIKAKAKKWGSSLGIIIPKAVVEKRKIRENDEIVIEIKKMPLAGDFFGRFKGKFTKSTQQLKDEAKRGWD